MDDIGGDDARTSARPAAAVTRTGVVVLGMHRSGTSMAAGILGKLGCDPAAHLMPANFANEAGYFESHPIAMFNDRLLISAGSDWKGVEKIPPSWFASPHARAARDEARDLLASEFGTSPLFVLKDPRICRLMPFWREVFAAEGLRPLILHVHRSPLAVAASLVRRDGYPRDYCLLMWLRNVLQAERESRGLTRHFVSYERLLANWGRETARAAESFGMAWPRLSDTVAGEIRGFVAQDLRHHDYRPEEVIETPDLPDWIRDSFAVLEAWARDGETAADHDRLDAIRDAVDRSMPAFAGLAQAALDGRAAAARAETERERQRGRIEELTQQHAAAEAEAAQWRATSAELHRRIETDAAKAERQDRARQAELAGLRDQLAEQKTAQAAATRTAATQQAARDRAFRDEIAAEAAAHKTRTAEIAAHHEARIAELRQALEGAQAEIQRLDRERGETSDHRDLLLASSSWRITAPLRRLSGLVRPR